MIALPTARNSNPVARRDVSYIVIFIPEAADLPGLHSPAIMKTVVFHSRGGKFK